MNFGKNFQTLRKAKNISQEKLAEELNVSRQAVGKWETGSVYPDIERLVQICDYFGVSMDELVRGDIENETITSETIGGGFHMEGSEADNRMYNRTQAEVEPEIHSEGYRMIEHKRMICKILAFMLIAISPFLPGDQGGGTVSAFLMFLCIISGIALLLYNAFLKKQEHKKVSL